MLILVGLSAFFSGAETAFFSLTSRQINEMKLSRNHFVRLSATLISQPGNLLSCFLFGNMTVNVLYFAFISIVTIRIQHQLGIRMAAVAAFLLFCMLVLFGDIVPKSIAYVNSRTMSIVASLPTYLSLRLFMPFIKFFKFIFVEPALRLLLGPVRRSKNITESEFRSLIKHIKKRGLITADQDKLINEIIELGTLKVRDCLKPRVDMIACNVADKPESIRKTMMEHNLTKVPVYAGKIDNIIGIIYLRQILLEPEKTTDKLVKPAFFIPEQKSVESLLEFFRKTHTDTVAVVDEYGGIAGIISLEDVAEELLGPIEITKHTQSIESIGPFQYRLSGDVPIREWADAFAIDLSEARITTIGGLVTALLGRIPRSGDVARLGNLIFTVEKIQRRRIETVIMTFEQIRSR
jgi:CBS domain containing-hemolysin-like protein